MEAEAGFESPFPQRYDVKSVPFPGRTGTCHGVEILPDARKGVCDVRGDGLPAGR